MKTALNIEHKGTIDADTHRMRIDERSLDKIMRIVTDLYSDREMAVIREYSTNAWDSHVEAGITDPIEVELPGSLDPMFRVRDHGLGLTVQQVIENVGSYGFSSKDHSDDYNGQLGLGSKSGLTYTPQFTYTVVKNGVKGVVLITRDRDGGGAMKVLDTRGTDEPNGVLVEIPVEDVDSFNQRAKRFYSFWERGTVLVDGVEPKPMFEVEDAMVIDPDIILIPKGIRDYTGEYDAKSWIVQGNVAYPFQQSWDSTNGKCVVVRVPIGSVDFTPSREALDYTKRTKDTIETAHQFIEANGRRSFEKKLGELKSHSEALRFAHEVSGMTKWSVVKYMGEQPPSEFRFNEAVTWITDADSEEATWSKTSRIGREHFLAETPRVRNRYQRYDYRVAVVVIGSKAMSSSPQFKCKLRQYLVENKLDGLGRVLITDQPWGIKWWGDLVAAVVPVEDVKAMPGLEKDSVKRTRRPRGINLLRSGGGYDTVQDLPDDVVCWIESGTSDGTKNAVYEFVQAVGKQCVYVLKADMARFKRQFPNAPHFVDWVQDELDALAAQMCLKHGLTIEYKYNFEDNSKVQKALRFQFPHESIPGILDPKLRTVANIAKVVYDKECMRFAKRWKNALDLVNWIESGFRFRCYDEVPVEGPIRDGDYKRDPWGNLVWTPLSTKVLNEFGEKVAALHLDKKDMPRKYAHTFVQTAERQKRRYWVLQHLPHDARNVEVINAMYLATRNPS